MFFGHEFGCVAVSVTCVDGDDLSGYRFSALLSRWLLSTLSDGDAHVWLD